MTDEQVQIIQKTAEELLEVLSVSATCNASAVDDTMVLVTVEAEETGMLIGYHGETLEALQLLISLAAAKKLGSFIRVSLEIGDYKKNREEWLKQLVQQTKERVLEEGQPMTLPNLKPWERRVVHLMLQDDQEVTTESMGEGRDRVLTISPRQ